MKAMFKSNLFSLGLYYGLSVILITVTNHYILTINFFDNSGEYMSGIPNQESEVYEALQKYIYLSSILYTTFKVIFYLLYYLHSFIPGRSANPIQPSLKYRNSF